MKVKKFYESAQNWSTEKLAKMYDDNYELTELILSYLELKHKDLFKSKKEQYSLREFWFEEDQETDLFSVFFQNAAYSKQSDIIEYDFSGDELDDLLEYMNNPSMYLNSNKYNI